MDKRKSRKFQSIGNLLADWNLDKKKYITREFQDYGYRLALELGDEKNKSLYIKLAKEEKRAVLEQARTFVKDAANVRSRAKLFMWALKKLRLGEPLYEKEE
ncbi:hypothetical protein IH980_05300 [Patescibacteria group bacterium]|nr:hypothetical protein [Patescibacteria group bacterium]